MANPDSARAGAGAPPPHAGQPWRPADVAAAAGVALMLGLQLVIPAVEMWVLYLHFATAAELAAVVRVVTRLMPRRVRVPVRRAFAPRTLAPARAH